MKVSSSKSNYRVISDSFYSYIEITSREANDYDVFKTFPAAKKALIELINDQIREWKDALHNARKLTLNDIN